MVTIPARNPNDLFIGCFRIHETLRQNNGIQAYEWIQISSSVKSIGHLVDILKVKLGITQDIHICFKDSYLRADLIVDVLRLCTADVWVVPASPPTTSRGSVMEEILDESVYSFYTASIANSSQFSNMTETVTTDDNHSTIDDEQSSDTEKLPIIIAVTSNYVQDISSSTSPNLVQDSGHQDRSMDTSEFNSTSPGNIAGPSKISLNTIAGASAQRDSIVSPVNSTTTTSETRTCRRKMKFTNEENPEGLKTSKIFKTDEKNLSDQRYPEFYLLQQAKFKK